MWSRLIVTCYLLVTYSCKVTMAKVRWSPEEENLLLFLVVHNVIHQACADILNLKFNTSRTHVAVRSKIKSLKEKIIKDNPASVATSEGFEACIRNWLSERGFERNEMDENMNAIVRAVSQYYIRF